MGLYQEPQFYPSYYGQNMFGNMFTPLIMMGVGGGSDDQYAYPEPVPIDVEPYSGTETGNDKGTSTATGADQSPTSELARMIAEREKRFFDFERWRNSPEVLAAQLEATEPFEERRARRQQELGMQSNAAGFLLKGLPDMLMKAYASRAAYYPEMIAATTRGLAEGFKGGADASKPRFDYYQGLMV